MCWSTFLPDVHEVLTVKMLKMDLRKFCFLVTRCRKNRVTPRSDFMQFVGETGEVVAESHSEEVILKQAASTLL